jgi:hypothetical protein
MGATKAVLKLYGATNTSSKVSLRAHTDFQEVLENPYGFNRAIQKEDFGK